MDYNKAIEISTGIYWVGYNDVDNGLHSNPYLIIEGTEAVLIDGGSRPDFSTVMTKILQTGIHPDQLVRLIYHHYDPDLVGSVSNYESIINNNQLEIISQRQNNVFIPHYSTSSNLACVNSMGNKWAFASGRELQFINTPYSHSPGSFMTYDPQTKVLFSSDIFGSYGAHWDLYIEILEACKTCTSMNLCPLGHKTCFLPGILQFHQVVMTSAKALRYALDQIKTFDIEIIAPQHGSLIKGKESIAYVIDQLYKLDNIGIDGFLENGVDHI